MCYSDLVELFLLFYRVCTTYDLKLFTFCQGELCAIFYARSCPNYAQWMTRYHLDLLYIGEAHPAACAMLELHVTGAMFIRGTNKPLFRSPADWNIGQLANAGVPFRLKGMASFYESVSARRRWIVTRSVVSEHINHLIESDYWKRIQM